jgi:hypothetical protein
MNDDSGRSSLNVKTITPLENCGWLGEFYSFLDIPPLPTPDPPRVSLNTRMYAQHEAMAWVSRCLMWLEEAHHLLVDSAYALTESAKFYGGGFPERDPETAMPGAFVFGKDRRPAPDAATVQRARFFRYQIDNSVIRTSASFRKVAGLLGEYYGVQVPHINRRLFQRLVEHWNDDLRVRDLQDIASSSEFVAGEAYRNPRIHGIGSSFSVLCGGKAELYEAIVFHPGMVGVKERPALTADELFFMARGFYEKAVEFMRLALSLTRDHPMPYSKDRPFMPRVLQNPQLHKGVAANKQPTEYTNEFLSTDGAMHCSVLVHNGRGHNIKVRWRTAGQSYDCPLSAVDVDEEIRCTAHNYRENDEEFQVGEWHVEWWLDGEQVCKVPFKVIRVARESER